MRLHTTVPEHVKETKLFHHYRCDLCGEVRGVLQTDKTGNASEVEIKANIGDCWPEGDDRTTYVVDICPPCFVAKVKPAIEALGIVFRKHDTDKEDASEELPNG